MGPKYVHGGGTNCRSRCLGAGGAVPTGRRFCPAWAAGVWGDRDFRCPYVGALGVGSRPISLDNIRRITNKNRTSVRALPSLGSRDAFLFAFDLLEIDGEDLRRYEWHVRRATLRSLIKRAGPGIRLSEHIDGDGAFAFRHACRMGLEGIVTKRRDKPYRSGRSPDWVKVKNPDAPAASRIMEW